MYFLNLFIDIMFSFFLSFSFLFKTITLKNIINFKRYLLLLLITVTFAPTLLFIHIVDFKLFKSLINIFTAAPLVTRKYTMYNL